MTHASIWQLTGTSGAAAETTLLERKTVTTNKTNAGPLTYHCKVEEFAKRRLKASLTLELYAKGISAEQAAVEFRIPDNLRAFIEWLASKDVKICEPVDQHWSPLGPEEIESLLAEFNDPIGGSP